MSDTKNLIEILKKELSKQTATLSREINKLEVKVKQEGEETRNAITGFRGRLTKVENSVRDFDRILRKNNLVISGLSTGGDDLVLSTLDFLNQSLGVSVSEDKINNIFRLNNSKPGLIKVEFTSFLTKNIILKNKSKLRGTKVYINEDLGEHDRADLRLLKQHLKQAKEKNLRSFIRGLNLFVNGEKFTAADLRDQGSIDGDMCEVEEDRSVELASNSAPGTPDPVSRLSRLSSEYDHIKLIDSCNLNKEIALQGKVLNSAVNLVPIRKNSQSSADGRAATRSMKNKK